jgi:hypothetical protein
MNRDPKASLSPHELRSLRQLSFDSRQPVSDVHRRLLLSMRLIKLNAGQMGLTSEGHERLMQEKVGLGTPP